MLRIGSEGRGREALEECTRGFMDLHQVGYDGRAPWRRRIFGTGVRSAAAPRAGREQETLSGDHEEQ